MKNRSLFRLLLGVAMLGFATNHTFGFFPEPGNIYYGVVRDASGRKITSVDGVRLIMQATRAGVVYTIASCDVVTSADGAPNFVLRPSLDDGSLNRYSPSAMRQGESVQVVYVRDGVTNALREAVPIIGPRASLIPTDLSALPRDEDGDGLPDEWEINFFGTLTATDGNSDFDGGGCNEKCEYENGCNPLIKDCGEGAPADPMVLVVVGSGPRSIIVDWQRAPGRSYSLEGASAVSGPFATIPSTRLIGNPNGSGPVTVNGGTNDVYFVRGRQQ